MDEYKGGEVAPLLVGPQQPQATTWTGLVCRRHVRHRQLQSCCGQPTSQGAVLLVVALLVVLEAIDWELWKVIEGPQHLGTQVFYQYSARTNRLACDDSSPWALEFRCSGEASCIEGFDRKLAQTDVLTAVEWCHVTTGCELKRPGVDTFEGRTPPGHVALAFHGH